MNDSFIFQPPTDTFLSSFVDYYFYIDKSLADLQMDAEYVLPFPRITFGYFFEHPFLVINHDRNETKTLNMAISKISSQKITVQPLTDRIKILGAHVRPFALAYLTDESIGDLPWLIKTEDLFKNIAVEFRQKIDACNNPQEMFLEVEKVFLDNILQKDLTGIIEAISIIEDHAGNVKLSNIADKTGVSERTLRNQFHKHIGCSPKEYIQLVKLKHSAYLMNQTKNSLTNISHESGYFDQAHFTQSVKTITGHTPKKLRKEMTDFRFLQF